MIVLSQNEIDEEAWGVIVDTLEDLAAHWSDGIGEYTEEDAHRISERLREVAVTMRETIEILFNG